MADQALPPQNLPIPPAGAEPGRGFDAPDPFEEQASSMPQPSTQPNPIIAPPQVDEILEEEQPVFQKPEMPEPKKSTLPIVIGSLIVVIILIIVGVFAAMRIFNSQKAAITTPEPSMSPTAVPDVSSVPAAVVSATPVVGADSEDPDNDGLNNAEERLYGTDPTKADTDGDGFPDGEEVKNGYNPLGAGKLDSDNDGLPDPDERKLGTDPFNPDTDGDGYSDGDEVAHGHNPLVPAPNDKL